MASVAIELPALGTQVSSVTVAGKGQAMPGEKRLSVNTSPTTGLHERIDQIFRAHVDSVFSVAYRVVWNRADAEDVVQASFVKAFTRLDQLSNDERERSWLLQIAYREAITVVRRRRDVPTDPSELPEGADQDSPEAKVVSSDVVRVIGEAIQSLNENERMAVVLRDVEQLPMAEVAKVLDVGLSTAKMRVHRGRQSLRLQLEKAELH